MEVDMSFTRVFDALMEAYLSGEYNKYVLQGGSGSSKTFSTMQFLILLAATDRKPTLTSVVSESLPHLKRGAIRDFKNIMGVDTGFPGWSETEHTYTFPTGSKIEFFGADVPSKLRGGRRDRLFINECNNLEFESFRQLVIRTKELGVLDYNPETRFWYHDYLQGEPGVWFHISTHHDNQYLSETARRYIESTKISDPEFYRVYGMGRIGKYKDIVFSKLKKGNYEEVYEQMDDLRFGLDFGYSPDPAAFVVCGRARSEIYVFKEIIAHELSNQELAEVIKTWVGDDVVYCDSSEPKSIRELQGAGVNAVGVGGKDRKYSITWLKKHNIFIQQECTEAYREFSRFKRLKDKSGNVLPVFQSVNDHTIDAVRYAFKRDMGGTGTIKSIHIPNI